MRLATLEQFRQLVFLPESAPTLRTLRVQVKDRRLPGGRILAGRFYVDMDEYERKTQLRAGLAAKKAELLADPLLSGLV